MRSLRFLLVLLLAILLLSTAAETVGAEPRFLWGTNDPLHFSNSWLFADPNYWGWTNKTICVDYGLQRPWYSPGVVKEFRYYFGHKKDVFPSQRDRRWNIIKTNSSSIKRNANISTENGERVVFLMCMYRLPFMQEDKWQKGYSDMYLIDRLPPSIDASLLKGNYTSKVSITLSTFDLPRYVQCSGPEAYCCVWDQRKFDPVSFFYYYGREQIVDKKFTAFDYIKRGGVPVYKRNPDNSIYAEVEDLSKRNTTHTFSAEQSGSGTWYLYVAVRDRAWNEGVAVFGPYTKTVIAPWVKVSPASRGWGKTNVTANITYGTNGGTKINTARYAVTKTSSYPSSGWKNLSSSDQKITLSSEGTWYVHAYVTNAAGVTRYACGGPYRIDKTAPTAPKINFTSPSGYDGNWTGKNVTFTVTGGSDAHSGIAKRQYRTRVDNGSWSSWKDYTSPVTLTSSGVWDIQARNVDGVGLVSPVVSAQARIDKSAPSISASPKSRSWKRDDVTVTLTFKDSGGSGFRRQQYAWSTSTSTPSSGWSSWGTGTSRSVSCSTSGKWYLHVRADDNAGNRATVTFGPYCIDKVDPTIDFDPGYRLPKRTDSLSTVISVTIRFRDTHSGLKAGRYGWSGSPDKLPAKWTSWSVGQEGTVSKASKASQSEVGRWYLHAEVEDYAGNKIYGVSGPYIKLIMGDDPEFSFNPRDEFFINRRVRLVE